MSPIPGGFATAPTVVLAALTSPSPGVQVTVTATDANAVNVTIYRTDSRGRFIVRGASHTTIATVYTVADFEVPIGESVIYSAATFDANDVPSDESAGNPITLTSITAWLTDPLTPATAVAVYLKDPPNQTLDIDRTLILPIGTTDPLQVSGERQSGSYDNLVLVALDETTRIKIMAVLASAPVVMLRAPDPSWDMPAVPLGIGGVRKMRIGRVQNPERYIELADATIVARTDPSIAGPLWTWDDVLATGISWNQLAATKTWLSLLRDGPL